MVNLRSGSIIEKTDFKTVKWTEKDAEQLAKGVQQFGRNWTLISNLVFEGKYSSRRCQAKWTSCFKPVTPLQEKAWSLEELKRLQTAHKKFGPKWSKISKRLKGRTPAQVEYIWKQHLEANASNSKHPSSPNKRNTLLKDLNLIEITLEINKKSFSENVSITISSPNEDFLDSTFLTKEKNAGKDLASAPSTLGSSLFLNCLQAPSPIERQWTPEDLKDLVNTPDNESGVSRHSQLFCLLEEL